MELILRNQIEDLAIARDALDQLAVEYRLPTEVTIAVQVIIDELISNVIKYAWPSGGEHTLFVRFTVDMACVKVELSDDGQGYDPTTAPPPPTIAGGRRPMPGKVGLHLVRQLADAIEYRRIDGFNHVTVTKTWTGAATTGRDA
jgi:anti-sigma regulatory factor (Ser/Thr protein kinase)